MTVLKSERMNKQFKRLMAFDDLFRPLYWLGVDSGKKGGVTLLNPEGKPVSLGQCAPSWDVSITWDAGACLELAAAMARIAWATHGLTAESVVIVHEEPAGHRENSWKTFAPVMMLIGILQMNTIVEVVSVENSWWKARAGIGTHQKTKAAKASSIALAKLATGQDMGHDEADSYHMVKAVFNEYSLFKRLQTKKTS
jgi:hypothetical protein